MADDTKKKKDQNVRPGGGAPRRTTRDGEPVESGNPFAEDPYAIYRGAPLAGYAVDYRRTPTQGGDDVFVNGRGVDTSRTENQNFVSEVNRHERAMFRRRAAAEKEDWDAARRAKKDRRYQEQQTRRRQEYADRNFEGAKFNSREGWANLGRTGKVNAEGKVVASYGRGAEGVKDYDARYAEMKRRADILTKAFESGDFTGRGKEWAAIRKEVAKTHESGGLTEKQLEGIEKKMDALRDGLNERAESANRLQAFYQKKALKDQRRKLGDAYGLLSDDQVKTMSEKKKWDSIRKASDAYLASVNQPDGQGGRVDPDTKVMGFKRNGEFGTVSRGGDRVQAMQDLLDNGISLTQMARMAVRSRDKKWTDAYSKIMSSEASGDRRDRAVESLGHAYLRSMLAKGDEGVKALTAGIEAENTVTGKAKAKGPNKMVSWDAATSDGSPVTTPEQRANEQVRRAMLPAQSEPELSPKNWDTASAELGKPVQERQTVEANDGGQTLPMTAEEFDKIQNTPLKGRGELLPKPTPEQTAAQFGSVVYSVLKPRKRPEDE